MIMKRTECREKAKKLLSRMTTREKIGQLHQVWGIDLIPGVPNPDDMVRQGLVGSMLYVMDRKRKNELQRMAVEESPSGIPILFGQDVGHGYETGFPIQLAMAATFSPELTREVAAAIAEEASEDGLHWTFFPQVDICRDLRWGRIIEGAGEDPCLGSEMAAAWVRGFQGDEIGSEGHLMACAKHFAGYGAADGGRDYDPVNISEADLRNVYLPPFKAAVDAGVGTVMSAYMDLNNVPASANAHTLTDILRKEWGFDGFVVSDASAIRNLVTQGFAKDINDAANRSFHAGVNMDMSSYAYLQAIPELMKQGLITEEELDARVLPVLEMKYALGLFEHPYVDEEGSVSASDHRALARKAAAESMVLLRNEGSLLPLKREYRKIAVIGPLADSQDATEGIIGLYNRPSAVTVLNALRQRLPECEISYAPGPWINRTIPNAVSDIMPDYCGNREKAKQTQAEAETAFTDAVDICREAEIVIAVMGEGADMSGEAGSRSQLGLPGRQLELLKAVNMLGKPIVLVLLNGHPLSIPWEAEHIPAILEAWQPGWEGGNAVADILFGDYNPGARLPVTIPRNAAQLPMYYARNNTHRPENAAGALFTSRYWDEQSSPLYSFGYGLSYTTFALSDLKFEHESIRIGETCRVSVSVTNTGKDRGSTVVQLYLHQRYGSDSRPAKLLSGFRKVHLEAQQSETVVFEIGPEQLTYYSASKNAYVQDETILDVMIGQSQEPELTGSIEVVA